MTERHFTTEELANEEWRVCAELPNYAVSNLGRIRRETAGHTTWPGRVLADSPSRGYRALFIGKRRVSVHRLVAVAFLGEAPEGKPHVNHKDGVKTNNAAANLEWVSPKENQQHASRLGLTAKGSRNGAYTRPDRVPRGDRNGSRTKPESRPRGDSHFSRLHPERLARGDRNGSRLHPERLARGDQSPARMYPERLARGERHWRAALTESDVREIRARCAVGETKSALAREKGTSVQAVWSVVMRRTWRHVE